MAPCGRPRSANTRLRKLALQARNIDKTDTSSARVRRGGHQRTGDIGLGRRRAPAEKLRHIMSRPTARQAAAAAPSISGFRSKICCVDAARICAAAVAAEIVGP